MSLISDQELEQVRSRADIVEVIGERIPLKRAGRHLKGLCPFHGEKTPSFMVHPDKQIYHCFGCGAGGDVFSFLMKYDGLVFVEVVEKLAERYGITISHVEGHEGAQRSKTEKDLSLRINRLAARFFLEVLVRSDAGIRGREYLKRRDIQETSWEENGLGYAPAGGRSLVQLFQKKEVPIETALKLGLVRRGTTGENYDFFRDRLIFSVIAADGRVLGFSGRALEDTVQPKYLNSPESLVYHKGDSLLGLQAARSPIRDADQVILVEGNFDMVRLHQAGLRNVVAPLGTALTELQVRNLARLTKNFVLIFDGDAAGRRAASRALEISLPLGLSPRVVLLPEGEDPDTFVRHQGLDSLQKMMTLAPSLFDTRIEEIFAQQGQDPQGQSRAIQEVAALIALLQGDLEKQVYFQRVAQRFGLSEMLIQSVVAGKKSRAQSSSRKSSNFSHEISDERQKLSRIPPLERTVLEVLLSGHRIPEVLFKEIGGDDFSDPEASELWKLLKEDQELYGTIDVARILKGLSENQAEGGVRILLTALAIRGSRWQGEGAGDQAAADCLRQLRARGLRERLKTLTTEIRQAEMVHDMEKVRELMGQQNLLVQEIRRTTNLH